MGLINQGLNNRIFEVQVLVEKNYSDVASSISKVENLTQLLLREHNEDVSALAHELDVEISNLITSSIAAAYRIGIAEGMNLQQEINLLCKG